MISLYRRRGQIQRKISAKQRRVHRVLPCASHTGKAGKGKKPEAIVSQAAFVDERRPGAFLRVSPQRGRPAEESGRAYST